MPHPIVIIARAEEVERRMWLKALSAAVPEEQFIESDAVSSPEHVEIAIVANPQSEDLLKFPNLKWVQSLWAGVEALLSEPSLAHIPLVRMVDNGLADTMAEAVLAWVLYLHRDMPVYAEQQQQKFWQQLPFTRAADRTVGILGLGHMGMKAVSALKAAGFDVCGWSRSLKDIEGLRSYAGSKGLQDMFGQADIVVSLLPSTPQTESILNAEALADMKPGASLINFGRGNVLDDKALIEALDAGHINHAVLDVFREEPLPPNSPFWEHKRITVLPHISAPTDPKSACKTVAENIRAYRSSGGLPVCVDRALGY